MTRLCGWLLIGFVAAQARAGDATFEESRRARVEEARAEVARQVQLMATDLLDELVYGWTQSPPFASATPVVLADLTTPLGTGSGLEALLENHVAGLLVQNPKAGVRLVHCAACTALVVRSTKEGTIIARGIDAPEALEEAGQTSGGKHALFLDFEAEGTALVLRARLVSLEPDLPILYARTLSTTAGTPALLRESAELKSAEAAREEYLERLEQRGTLLIPTRLSVRSFAAGEDQPFGPPPFIWLQTGAELALSQARAWTGGLSLGASWLPGSHTGLMLQARIARLLTGSSTSLTHPDIYAYAGLSLFGVQGVGAAIFADETPSIPDLIASVSGLLERTAVFPAGQVGLEMRIQNRISAGVFVETAPTLDTAPGLGNWLDLGLLRVHTLGAEVSFCF